MYHYFELMAFSNQAFTDGQAFKQDSILVTLNITCAEAKYTHPSISHRHHEI